MYLLQIKYFTRTQKVIWNFEAVSIYQTFIIRSLAVIIKQDFHKDKFLMHLDFPVKFIHPGQYFTGNICMTSCRKCMVL